MHLVEALHYKPGQGFNSQWCILCFVDRTSVYNLVNKANLVHNFFSRHILDDCAHHQEK